MRSGHDALLSSHLCALGICSRDRRRAQNKRRGMRMVAGGCVRGCIFRDSRMLKLKIVGMADVYW